MTLKAAVCVVASRLFLAWRHNFLSEVKTRHVTTTPQHVTDVMFGRVTHSRLTAVADPRGRSNSLKGNFSCCQPALYHFNASSICILEDAFPAEQCGESCSVKWGKKKKRYICLIKKHSLRIEMFVIVTRTERVFTQCGEMGMRFPVKNPGIGFSFSGWPSLRQSWRVGNPYMSFGY